MTYRDDLDAARARIETLEARIREREASLGAREAELAELRMALDRLQRDPGEESARHVHVTAAASQRSVLVALGACAFLTTAAYAMVRPSACHGPRARSHGTHELRASAPAPHHISVAGSETLPVVLEPVTARPRKLPAPPAPPAVKAPRVQAVQAVQPLLAPQDDTRAAAEPQGKHALQPSLSW
ncbi:hypothetical protein [Chondromyces apiculatus]|uniref:Uncharacterized protein n=1 Tax=Chondromyces apiculatus DSM 436 TaxID=1192034 RepID=A0A017SZE1_9BACT|nr:hypothetical protein [Chondromyces apiculatus]EYF02112.1 Hypothetical protein CAP_7452 [Chondromyces apiculatus DSM 436]